jgi:hypothetical protein
MTNLNDTHLVILSAAAKREDRAVTLPETLKGGAARKFVEKLTRLDLIQEQRAGKGMPVWRRDDENRSYTLRITAAGLQAIGAEEEESAEGAHSAKPKRRSKAASSAKPRRQPTEGRAREQQSAMPKGKLGTVVALLGGRTGASIEELGQATGWQAHSVRGALSGALKKKYGLAILSEKIDGTRRYRLADRKAY